MVWRPIELVLLLLLCVVLFLLPLLLIFWLHFGDLWNRGRAKMMKDDRVEFPPGRLAVVRWLWMLWICGGGAVGATLEAYRVHNSWYFALSALAGLAFFGTLFSFPETVATTREGVEQIYWFRRNKRIRWIDIAEVGITGKCRRIAVRGIDGTEIVHSRKLADRSRFLTELRQHCESKLPAEFPREPASAQLQGTIAGS